MLTVYVGNFNDGQVEGTTTQVVYRHRTVTALLVHAVGKGRCGRLVDDPLDFETGNLARVFRRLALAVIEVGRHGDNRGSHFLTQIVFCGFLHLLEDFGRNLGRSHLLALHLYPRIAIVGLGDFIRHHLDVFLNHIVLETTTDQSLDGVQRVVRVGHRLTLG